MRTSPHFLIASWSRNDQALWLAATYLMRLQISSAPPRYSQERSPVPFDFKGIGEADVARLHAEDQSDMGAATNGISAPFSVEDWESHIWAAKHKRGKPDREALSQFTTYCLCNRLK